MTPKPSLIERLAMVAQACHAAHILSCEATCEEAIEELTRLTKICEQTRAHSPAPSSEQPVEGDRFFIDHGVIHDRITGRHVHGDREIEPGIADEAVFMLNELHASALREIQRYTEKESAHVAWCRYVIQHDQPTRIVLCNSDAKGAFKVFKSHPHPSALEVSEERIREIAIDHWHVEDPTLGDIQQAIREALSLHAKEK